MQRCLPLRHRLRRLEYTSVVGDRVVSTCNMAPTSQNSPLSNRFTSGSKPHCHKQSRAVVQGGVNCQSTFRTDRGPTLLASLSLFHHDVHLLPHATVVETNKGERKLLHVIGSSRSISPLSHKPLSLFKLRLRALSSSHTIPSLSLNS